ncbi:hypothetical protein KEM09_21500 [Carboxylicivirga mesophila]|uniref:Uncharacterized protein n=1 Tax=Carboxylicivirga mesophila TaxID=1166478 RepID=A0ABS5KFZ8_9BACT|nr:hypothetical protein [Carboxylicivirga mesophila]MBS2213999.1 hypothetical protein [Carboxylicivirga mesophila]
MSKEKREKLIQEEYERLKALVGEKKANEYFKESNYPFRTIGELIILKAIIDFYKSMPRNVKIIAVVLFLFIILAVINTICDNLY